jgi:hypothetical protein
MSAVMMRVKWNSEGMSCSLYSLESSLRTTKHMTVLLRLCFWYFFHHCPQQTCPMHTSNIPGSKSHAHFLALRSFIKRICPCPRLLVIFHNKFTFYSEEMLPHAQPPSWRTTPCRLSATAYSIYLQLSSISGGLLLHPQPPEDVPCSGDKGPIEHGKSI